MKQIILERCPNVRDPGGMKGSDGKTVRSGILIRSSKPTALTREDRRILTEDLRVSRIIDLRTEREAAEEPDADLGCAYDNIPLRPDVKAGVKYRFPESLKAYSQKFPSMPQMYVNMLTTEYSLGQLRRIFEIVFDAARKGECVLFHCSEGKDRTGIVAALAELLLGVDRDEIMRDYLISNECFRGRNRFYSRLIAVAFRDAEYVREFRMMFEAHPSMLRSLFEIVDDCGGIGDYFTNQLGFTKQEIDSFIHDMLCEEA